MKARKGLKWLACALVGAASMVLLGCPHNNVIEHDVVSGSGTTGRGTNGGVQLVITNFVKAGAGTNRSARTVAPEHIDLTNQDRINEYIFVVTGTGDAGVYGPKLIDIAAGTGVAELPGLQNGRWDITIDAYNVEKLKVAEVSMAAMDRNAIMQTQESEIQNKIVAHKGAAVVLSGQASLHLGGSTAQVKLTLTSSSEAQYGDVNVAIHFPDANDKATIFEDGVSKYIVKARLADPASYQTIMGGTLKNETTEVTLFDLQNGSKDTSFAGNYDYKTYTKDGGYQDVQLQAGAGKLLQYRPSADPMDPTGAGQTPYKIPAGKYVLLVEVTTPTGEKYYAMDSDFYVEGNRTTTGVLEIKNLLGTKPEKPTGFEVYYAKPTTIDARDGYDATFAWQPNPADMAAVSYELELADITALYKNGGGSQIDIDGTPDDAGHETFANGEELWSDTDLYKGTMDAIRSNYVTSITWNNQANNGKYPFVKGTLLVGGGNSITLRLQTGHVYSARIRATNGAHSDWTYFTNFGATVPSTTEFAQAETTGIFDLVAITYELKDVDMYTLTGDRHTDMTIAGDTLVTDLLQVYEYDPNSVDEPLSYGFTQGQMAVTTGEQVLVAKNDLANKIVQSWQGWQNKDDTAKMFGPVVGQNAKDQWIYEGFKNLTLIPVGAGGSSLQIQVETADTTNVLSLSTVGFSTNPIAAAPLATSTVTTTGLAAYKTSDPAGVYRNTAGTELVLVLNANNTDHTSRALATTDLYVAIGDSDAAGGVSDTLSDKNGNPITVNNLKVELKQGITTMKSSDTFTPAVASTNPAYATFTNTKAGKLGGVARGKYTLYITMTTAGGYEQSIQIPVTILYQDMTANINDIP